MHPLLLISAILSLGSLVASSPVMCPDVRSLPFIVCPPHAPSWTSSSQALTHIPVPQQKRDAILKGELPKEACCSYGRCLGDVVISMS